VAVLEDLEGAAALWAMQFADPWGQRPSRGLPGVLFGLGGVMGNNGQDPGSKVISVRINGLKSWRQLRPAADNVALEIRRLEGEGYDLRGGELRAWLVRDDKAVEPREHVRYRASSREAA